MITTFQSLSVALLALLPGAAYTYSYERMVGSFGVRLADRLVRFFVASALFTALFSGVGLWVYRDYVLTGSLASASIEPWRFQIWALLYVGVPAAVGTLVGYGYKRGWRLARAVVGEAPEPRAWDYLWRSHPQAVVRVKLKSGTWVAGVFGTTETGSRSYAAGYAEEADIFLSRQLQVDALTGEYVRDADDRPVPTEPGSGLLLRWNEIEYLDYLEIRND